MCVCVCVCVLVGVVTCLKSLLVVSVCGETDRRTDRQGWTDRLRQAKQQVCLLNAARRHTNALLTVIALLILVFIGRRKDFSSSLSLTVFHL